uniref:Malonyl-CoA:ACP transacylase (MAT) domain-containing protein n=1 Tax=Timema monikensis TaxID=170555 RepID=A0A7R9EFC0_9NEOP|nr:unnamed protein product [Timema monikensis]
MEQDRINEKSEIVPRKLTDLEVGRGDRVTSIKALNTRFSRRVLTVLDGKYNVWLPNRFSLLTDGQLEDISKAELLLVYNGISKLSKTAILNFEAVRSTFPQGEDKLLTFSQYKQQEKTGFIVYTDLESLLVPIETCDPDMKFSYTENVQRHVAYSVDPFSFEAVDKLDNSLQTEFLDLKYDCEAKIIFKQSGYELGWVKIMDTYPQLVSERVCQIFTHHSVPSGSGRHTNGDLDTKELNALAKVLLCNRQTPLPIGSIKSNLGHTDAASALVSVVKVLIAMETGRIPPNYNYNKPSQQVPALVEDKYKVVTETMPWSGGLAAVNAVGLSGVVGHILLRSHSKEKVNGGLPNDKLPRLLLISGRTEEGLKEILTKIALVDFMKLLDITPDGYVGHSLGELGCAYMDGCFTAEETLLVAYYRGLASNETELIPGYMAAIAPISCNSLSKYFCEETSGLFLTSYTVVSGSIGPPLSWTSDDVHDVKDVCPPEIDVACHNSSSSSTISGPEEIVKTFVKQLQKENIFARAVNVANIAYHSRYIKPAAPKLLEYLKKSVVIGSPCLRNPGDRLPGQQVTSTTLGFPNDEIIACYVATLAPGWRADKTSWDS